MVNLLILNAQNQNIITSHQFKIFHLSFVIDQQTDRDIELAIMSYQKILYTLYKLTCLFLLIKYFEIKEYVKEHQPHTTIYVLIFAETYLP